MRQSSTLISGKPWISGHQVASDIYRRIAFESEQISNYFHLPNIRYHLINDPKISNLCQSTVWFVICLPPFLVPVLELIFYGHEWTRIQFYLKNSKGMRLSEKPRTRISKEWSKNLGLKYDNVFYHLFLVCIFLPCWMVCLLLFIWWENWLLMASKI